MPQYGRKFCFEVLTMDGKNFVADAVSVTFPATDGMVGVLAGRAPLIASIGIGTLSVQDDQGKHKYYFVAGGFARVRENAMTLLADICQPLEQINACTCRPSRPDASRSSAFPFAGARASREVIASAIRIWSNVVNASRSAHTSSSGTPSARGEPTHAGSAACTDGSSAPAHCHVPWKLVRIWS